MKIDVNFEVLRAEVIDEYFHPAGPVQYTNLLCRTKAMGLFDMTLKKELRQV